MSNIRMHLARCWREADCDHNKEISMKTICKEAVVAEGGAQEVA